MNSNTYGLVRIETSAGHSQVRYFSAWRVLRADAKGGDIEVTLVSGAKVRTYSASVIRWPNTDTIKVNGGFGERKES